MPNLPQQFDPSQHNDMRDFTPVPPGEYVCRVASSDVVQTKDKTGVMAILNFDIIAGEYVGKGFLTRLNIQNTNPKAMQIAQEELATICRAAGLGPILKTEQLHGKPILVKLTVEMGEGRYPPKNSALGYSSPASLKGVAPVNPPPDEYMLKIMSGEIRKDGGRGTAGPGPAAGGAVPDAPDGFAATSTEAPGAPTQQTTSSDAPPLPGDTAPADTQWDSQPAIDQSGDKGEAPW